MGWVGGETSAATGGEPDKLNGTGVFERRERRRARPIRLEITIRSRTAAPARPAAIGQLSVLIRSLPFPSGPILSTAAKEDDRGLG